MEYTIQTYIRKLLAGTLQEEERLKLINWFEGLPQEEAATFFDELGKQMEKLDDLQIVRIEEVLQQMQETPIPKLTSRKYPITSWHIAAAIVLVITCSWLFSRYWQQRVNLHSPSKELLVWKKQVNPTRTRSKLLLADSTWVWLNAGSTLHYPEKFTDSVRQVKLEGEAYFEVHPNSNKPFLVTTDHFSTQVLGTSFDMKVFEGEPITVTVRTGKVRVLDKNAARLLQKNQQVQYIPGNGLTEVKEVDAEASILWKKGVLNLNNKTLAQAAREMERWYGVNIIIKPTKLNKCVIAGEHTNMNLSDVLKSLAFVLKLKYTYQGNTVIITDGKCAY